MRRGRWQCQRGTEAVCRIGARRLCRQEKHARAARTGGAGDGDEAQGTAAEVESEVAGDGEAAMSETISLLVLAGAGDDGEPAASRARFSRRSSCDRFLTERAGGAGMEAAVA